MADKPSAIDKALKAMEEMEALKQAAIEELLQQRSDIDQKLQKLGHNQPAPVPVHSSPKTTQTRQRDLTKPCSYCGEIGHDARKHRAEIIAAKKAGK